MMMGGVEEQAYTIANHQVAISSGSTARSDVGDVDG
jgi:hypothetical protein